VAGETRARILRARCGGSAMNPRTKWGLGALALLAVASLWYGQRQTPDPVAAAIKPAATAPEAAARDVAADAPGDRARGQRPWPALPAVDAPLSTILLPLSDRADRGDPKAACRLAMELIRCQVTAYYQSIAAFNDSSLEKKLEAEGNLKAADSIAANQMEQLLRSQECQAVPENLRDRGAHYLAMAARAGEPEAMLRYADGMHWPLDGRGVYSDPEFDAWRRDAPRMLRRAFEAGVPEAPFLYWVAYQHDYGALSALIPNDPVKAEATRTLMVRLHGWSERPMPSQLDPTSLARASELARQWHEGLFQGRRYAGQDRSAYQFPGFPRQDDKPHAFCTGDRLIP